MATATQKSAPADTSFVVLGETAVFRGRFPSQPLSKELLLVAARSGHLATVRRLLVDIEGCSRELGVDLDAISGNACTEAMMVAVRHAQANAVRCIVDHAPRHLGANPTFNRYCILRHACEQGNSDIVRWYCNTVLPAAYRGEWGDLSQDVKSAITNALCIATKAGNQALLPMLATLPKEYEASVYRMADDLLLWACESGDVATVRHVLVEYGPRLRAAAIERAASRAKWEALRLVCSLGLGRGPCIGRIRPKTLASAARGGDVPTVRLLCEVLGCMPHVQHDEFGAVMVAAEEPSRVHVLRYLVAHLATLPNGVVVPAAALSKAFTRAVENSNWRGVSCLLEDVPACRGLLHVMDARAVWKLAVRTIGYMPPWSVDAGKTLEMLAWWPVEEWAAVQRDRSVFGVRVANRGPVWARLVAQHTREEQERARWLPRAALLVLRELVEQRRACHVAGRLRWRGH